MNVGNGLVAVRYQTAEIICKWIEASMVTESIGSGGREGCPCFSGKGFCLDVERSVSEGYQEGSARKPPILGA